MAAPNDAQAQAKANGTILLTGANGTLGSAIASRIASSPELSAQYHGLYTVRNEQSASALKNALSTSSSSSGTPHPNDILSLDLSSLSAVRDAAAKINARVASGEIPPLRALILNAGYLEFTEQNWSQDGFDMTFACNYLAHWLLTLLLLQSMDKESGRIVLVTSESHDPFNSKNKNAGFAEKKWQQFVTNDTFDPIAKGTWSTTKDDPAFSGGYRRYGASKFCQAAMIGELQRRLDADPALSNICILGLDPGTVSSSLTRRGPWMVRILVNSLVVPLLALIISWLNPNGTMRTVPLASGDLVRAALDTCEPLGEKPKGLYMYGSRLEEMTAEARDDEKRRLLWRESVGYTQLRKEETVLYFAE